VSKQPKCSACGNPLDAHNEGIELWGSTFCSTCFITNAAKTHREFTAADVEILRRLGKELAGFLPGDLLEMILVGFHKRSTGGNTRPPEDELTRCVGEIQRLTAFATFRQILNLMKTWQSSVNELVENQEAEIRDKIKRLTDLE
jgi:hypothetical protein